MTREEEIRKSAFEYIKSDAVKAGEEYTSFGDFINGAKWADEHPHWISFDEEMPPMDKDVLVITKAKRLIIAKSCYPAPLNDWWDSDGRYIQNDKPTHWMPLPQAPKKGGKE